MTDVKLADLAPTSACAVVARSSAVQPEFVVADAGPRFVVARWRRRAARLNEPAKLDDHMLSYCLRGGARSTIVVDGIRRSAVQRTGAFTFVPAGRPVQWLLEAPAETMHLHLYLAQRALGATPKVFINLQDPWLDGYFRLLMADLEACRRDAALDRWDFLDRTADLLLHRLVPLLAGERPAARPSRVSPLRLPILRRIEAHVEDHLSDDLRLEDLAAIASMSVDHFVRAFREATGTTPHRWLLERRLDKACALLTDSGERVAAIARRCGFASAAHFAATFHSRHGTTPSDYRRAER
jgi:AraC family transcriptional regulator